jgi:hypothetical protein
MDYRYFLSVNGIMLSSSEMVSSLRGEMRLLRGDWKDLDFRLSMENLVEGTGMSTMSSSSPISEELMISSSSNLFCLRKTRCMMVKV